MKWNWLKSRTDATAKRYSIKQIVGADPEAQELFKFYDTVKNQGRDSPTTLIMLLGTAVRAPDYFRKQPLTKASNAEQVQLPRDSWLWGTDFLSRNLPGLRRRLGEGDVQPKVRDIDVFLNLALPEIEKEIQGSDAYKAALGIILYQAIVNLLGRDFIDNPSDKMQTTLARRLGPLNQAQLRNELYAAAHAGRINDVTRLLLQGADPNSKNDGGAAALHAAAIEGHTTVVKELLARGAGVDPRNESAATPLHGACLGGHREIVRVLIGSGADVNAQLDDGGTPLHIVAEGCHTEIAGLLLGARADVRVNDNYGATPLHIAARQGCKQLAEMLLGKGADANGRDNLGVTPLHHAVINQGTDTELIELLLRHKADPYAKDHGGFSALMFAEAKGLSNTVAIMRRQ